MRVVSTFSAAALAVAALSVSSDALAQRNRGQAAAVVLNYQRVAAESTLGRDLTAKLATLRQQFASEAQALQPEQQSLQQERERLAAASRNMTAQQIQSNSTLAPQFQQFAERLQQLEGRAGALQGDMQCSTVIAMRDFQNQLEPVVRQVMQQRGAGIVIDSNSAVFAPELDITNTVIQQLNENQNTRTANVTRRSASECAPPQGAAPSQ
jgi:Skp family chaperone for outer membrane proteins